MSAADPDREAILLQIEKRLDEVEKVIDRTDDMARRTIAEILDKSGRCPKCKAVSGDDWSQCKGACPIPGSPHYYKPGKEKA